MKIFPITRLLLPVLSLLIFSCASKKDVVYLQGIDRAKSYDAATVYEPVLQPDDLLSIVISTESREIAAPFNLPEIQSSDSENRGLRTYLIDNAGYIDFPILGKIKLGGLTRTEANNKLVAAVTEYVQKPIVDLRIVNYKISVLGEVAKPGSYNIAGERVTLLEALSLGGDLTIYGKRDNLLVIREKDGKKTYNRVDITQPDFLNSPFYYLSQNDVVYVEPNKTRVNASVIGPNVFAILSAVSLIATLVVVLTR